MSDRPADRHDLRSALEHDFKWLARREFDALEVPADMRDRLAAKVVDHVLEKAGRASREKVLKLFQAQVPAETKALRQTLRELEEKAASGPRAPDGLQERFRIALIATIQWPLLDKEMKTRAYFADAAGATRGLMAWELYAMRSFAGYILASSAYGDEGADVVTSHEAEVLDCVRLQTDLETIPDATRDWCEKRRASYLKTFEGFERRDDSAAYYHFKADVVATFLRLTGCPRDTESIIRAYDVFYDAFSALNDILILGKLPSSLPTESGPPARESHELIESAVPTSDSVVYFSELTGKPADVIAWEFCVYRWYGVTAAAVMSGSLSDPGELPEGLEQALRNHPTLPLPENFVPWWVSRVRKYRQTARAATTPQGSWAEATREFLEAIGCESNERTVVRSYAELKRAVDWTLDERVPGFGGEG
jgi:hypothetical protein